MARAYQKAGYAGIVVTDHFFYGNTAADRSLPWKDWVEQFCKGYEHAKEEGDKIGLQVFFGWESGYHGTEFLIYGLNKEWLFEHPEIKDADVKEQYELVHAGGGIVSHAHPFREEDYIPEIRLFPDCVDAVEGINATHESPASMSHKNILYNEKAIAYAKEHDIDRLVAHAPYTMNLCSAKPDIRQFGLNMLQDDMQRMEYTPGQYYNFHPGSHTGQGAETGISQIADALNQTLTPEQTTTVLLETMAGKGSEVGRSFEELREILDRVTLSEKMGVCLDTCHIWDAGYNIADDLDGVLTQFDKVIGLHRLYAVHLNDSMNPCGAHKDRHQKLGQGCIGLDALVRVVNHPALKHLPFILETPNEDAGYAAEIALMREKSE